MQPSDSVSFIELNDILCKFSFCKGLFSYIPQLCFLIGLRYDPSFEIIIGKTDQ